MIVIRKIGYRAFVKRLEVGAYTRIEKHSQSLIENKMLPITHLHFSNGELIEINLDSKYGEIPNIPLYANEDKVILMEYTGLEDVTGAKIFEDDIIRRHNGEFGIVTFENGSFDVNRVYFVVNMHKLRLLEHVDWPNKLFEKCKVLGNKWENPDLFNPLLSVNKPSSI